MDDPQERQLAQGLRDGRIDAWHALYEAYAKPIWQYVARLMGPSAGEVADVVQETFLAAARSARTYDPARGPLRGWIVGIAKRQVALCYRKRERQDRIKTAAEWLASNGQGVICWLERRQQTPPEALASAELVTLVRAALSELSTDHQTLLSARYLDGVPVEELAIKDKSTVAAIRSKLARARRAFREVFGSHQLSASYEKADGFGKQ